MGIKVTRYAFGGYTVTDGVRKVDVYHFTKRDGAHFNGWIARADWDNYLVTDPMWTKREAVEQARGMLEDRAAGRL